MESKQIKALLDKYWEGESSLQEEQQLREYFAQEVIDEEFRAFKPMFQFFKQEQDAYLNGDFEERLSQKLKEHKEETPKQAKVIRFLARAAAVAAIFLAVIFAYSTWDSNSATQVSELNEKEKAEALLAYQEAKAALLLVSKKLKKGTGKAEQGIVQVRKATKVIR